MASIDELFKKPTPSGSKRKLDAVQDANEVYQRSKRNGHGNVQDGPSRGQAATVTDEAQEDDDMEGPEMPPDLEEGDEAGEDEDGRFFGGGVNRDTARAIALLDEVDGEEEIKQEKIDASWVRKLALSFEKKLSKNAELRAKYAEDPSKFMASEADLDSEIKALSVLSDHPALYAEFIRLNCVQSLMSLLAHENTDIAIDAVEIVAELIDDDVAEDSPEAWTALVVALLDAELLDLLESNVQRLDETSNEDRAGIAHVLNVLMSLASRSTSGTALANHAALSKWLITRAGQPDQTSPQAANTQGAAEALAILLQTSMAARKKFVAADGMDVCLQRLAIYRRGDPPNDSDEDEYAANMLASLIHGLNTPAGPKAFLDLEGVELAVLLLDAPGKVTRGRAIRLLDYALSSPYAMSSSTGSSKSTSAEPVASDLAQLFISSAGLKPLFSLLRKTKDSETLEHSLAVVSSLLRHLPAESTGRIRLLAKFVEKDYSIVSRVEQLRQRYAAALQKEAPAPSTSSPNDDVDDDAQERREAHQYGLRLVDTVLAWIGAEDEGIRTSIGALVGNVRDGLQGQLRDLKVDADADAEGEGKGESKGKGDAKEDGDAEEDEKIHRTAVREERRANKEVLEALVAALG